MEKVKDDFVIYSNENGYLITKRTKFVEAEYGDNYLKIRIEFELPNLSEKYNFKLVVIEENRREFVVNLNPDCGDLYIPQILQSAFRPKPQNQIELDKFNKDLENEFIFLDQKIIELTRVKFTLSYHNASHSPEKNEKLTTYEVIIPILQNLLSS